MYTYYVYANIMIVVEKTIDLNDSGCAQDKLWRTFFLSPF